MGDMEILNRIEINIVRRGANLQEQGFLKYN